MLHRWNGLWGDFWTNVCAAFGLEKYGEMTACVADGIGLYHLNSWRELIDRCCLAELCEGWGCWVQGRLAPQGHWISYARNEADRAGGEMRQSAEVPARIAHAAADLVIERGTGALTHRAVAERAGVTLGTVSYNFKTNSDLVRCAWNSLFTRAQTVEGVRDELAFDGVKSSLSAIIETATHRRIDLDLDELCIAAARDEAYGTNGAQLRYHRGVNSRVRLRGLLQKNEVSELDGALFSSFIKGRVRRASEHSSGTFATLIESELNVIRSLLGKPR
jgi:AcrR family transcriptional regulator